MPIYQYHNLSPFLPHPLIQKWIIQDVLRLEHYYAVIASKTHVTIFLQLTVALEKKHILVPKEQRLCWTINYSCLLCKAT